MAYRATASRPDRTGPDDETFCRKVSESLDLGLRLHGSQAVTFNGERVIVTQARLPSSAEKQPADHTTPGDAGPRRPRRPGED